MDLARKTLGQLMGSVFGSGKTTTSSASTADLDTDTNEESDDEGEESDDSGEETKETDETTSEKKEATAGQKKTASTAPAAGTVSLSLEAYNAMKADADQAKALKAGQAELKKKADAWDAHQKAVGAVTPSGDSTNDSSSESTEENAEAKEMKRLEARYKGMLPE